VTVRPRGPGRRPLAPAVVNCTNVPRRLQEFRSCRIAHAGADKIGPWSAPCSIAARSSNTTMTDHALSFMHDHAAIAAEASLDGFYVLRSSVPAARWCLVARGSSYSFWV
jgi:hypothetical protein